MNEIPPIRVMIVDDHLLVRDGLNLLLSTFDDLEVVALAEDGQQALAILGEREAIDLVVTDLEMPHVDGFELIEQLRARGGRRILWQRGDKERARAHLAAAALEAATLEQKLRTRAMQRVASGE